MALHWQCWEKVKCVYLSLAQKGLNLYLSGTVQTAYEGGIVQHFIGICYRSTSTVNTYASSLKWGTDVCVFKDMLYFEDMSSDKT